MATRYRLPDDFEPQRDVLIFSLGVGDRTDLVQITTDEMLQIMTSEHGAILGRPTFWAPLGNHNCALWPDPNQYTVLLSERRHGNAR